MFLKYSSCSKTILQKDYELDSFVPTTEILVAFDTLKPEMVDPPVLALLQPHKPYTIETNSPAYALKTVLLF